MIIIIVIFFLMININSSLRAIETPHTYHHITKHLFDTFGIRLFQPGTAGTRSSSTVLLKQSSHLVFALTVFSVNISM